MPSQTRLRAHGAAVMLVGLLVSATAGAAGAEESDADRNFRLGQKALEQGRIPQACALFESSLRADGEATGTLVNLAFCHEKDNKPGRAWNEFKRAENRAQGERREFVEKHLRELEPKIGHARVDVGPHAISDVKVDGEATYVDDRGRIVAEPGSHTVLVAVDGNKLSATKSSVNFRLGDNGDIRIVFESDTPPPPPPPPPPESSSAKPDEAGSSGNTKRTVGFVLTGIGVVSFALTAGFYAETLGIRNSACPTTTCSTQGALDRIHGSGQDTANAATVFGIVGLAALAGGIFLIATSGSSSPAVSTGISARVVPLVGAGGGGVRFEGLF